MLFDSRVASRHSVSQARAISPGASLPASSPPWPPVAAAIIAPSSPDGKDSTFVGASLPRNCRLRSRIRSSPANNAPTSSGGQSKVSQAISVARTSDGRTASIISSGHTCRSMTISRWLPPPVRHCSDERGSGSGLSGSRGIVIMPVTSAAPCRSVGVMRRYPIWTDFAPSVQWLACFSCRFHRPEGFAPPPDASQHPCLTGV